jgi:uncharacterized damage-inducible protein DinB
MAFPIITRLHEQLERVFERDAWHGPALLENLEGVIAADAARHPIAGAHSIWEIVLHVTATYDVVLRRLRGDGRPMTPAEDWPTPPAHGDEAPGVAWRAALDDLRRANGELRRAVQEFSERKLDAPIVDGVPYSAYVQFIGLTQHDAYHGGQIALLKRALAAPASA